MKYTIRKKETGNENERSQNKNYTFWWNMDLGHLLVFMSFCFTLLRMCFHLTLKELNEVELNQETNQILLTPIISPCNFGPPTKEKKQTHTQKKKNTYHNHIC